MSKKLLFFIAFLAIVTFALVSILGKTSESKSLEQVSNPQDVLIKDIYPKDVLTWDCEYPDYKPETIMLTCADGGWMVTKIKWQTWTTSDATGKGVFRENLCEPSCAEGKIVEAPVLVKLSNLTPYKDKFYLRTLDISTLDGKDFPWGRAGTLQWDVMEFAEMMNSDS